MPSFLHNRFSSSVRTRAGYFLLRSFDATLIRGPLDGCELYDEEEEADPVDDRESEEGFARSAELAAGLNLTT